TQFFRRILPRTAAQHAAIAVAVEPCRSVGWGFGRVVVVPAIVDPFRGIAVHVVQPKSVRREAANRNRLLPIYLRRTGAIAAAVVIRLMGRQRLAERKSRRRARARGVFPLRLGEEPVGLAGPFAQPIDIGSGIVPRNMDCGASIASPAMIGQPRAAAAFARAQ